MSCNSCSKTFSLFRPEKGCPNCGFSYCSKCLKSKLFSLKHNSEIMVCTKCKQSSNLNKPNQVQPPDVYYKRIGNAQSAIDNNESTSNLLEKDISDRLKKLKEDKQDNVTNTGNDIANRLQKLKGDAPSTSDAELQSRLANLKGVPLSTLQEKQVLPTSANKTEQEQVEDLMRQYMEQGNINSKYENEFAGLVSDIEVRLQKLRGTQSSDSHKVSSQDYIDNSEDEEETIKRIVEKTKTEAKLENIIDPDPVIEELPFCEICNEDAKMRCLGCKYLFCRQCFKEHEDSDDGCDKYEEYTSSKSIAM